MEKFVSRSVELLGQSGTPVQAKITSIASEDRVVVECHEYSVITHKRVVIHFREDETDQDFSIFLSPLGAMALVRRLVDTINTCEREGAYVPNLHSDLAYKSAQYIIDGKPIPAEDKDALAMYAETAYQEIVG